VNRSTRSDRSGRRRRRRARLPWLAAFGLSIAAAAVGQPLDLTDWETCRDGLRADAARRARLTSIADSLAAQRRSAVDAGDAAREQRLLARGEAVADSLREAALAELAHELLCAERRRELRDAIETRLAPASGSERDSLLALRDRVSSGAVTPVRAEFDLVPPELDDPPEILRLKGGYARDLVDRADRWLERLGRERQRLVQERLSAEAGGLVADQWFFDERAALRVQAGRPMEEGAAPPGFLGDLLRGGGRGAPNALELVDALERWLREKRSELVALADTLERQAQRRESER